MSRLRLLVGLGNPGTRYARTRHNAGFLALDAIAQGFAWKSSLGGLGEIASMDGLILAKPMTYMNESGRFVSEISRFYKISPHEILVCFDDLDIPLGRIRIRSQGSSGGQNGMKSIIEHLRTMEIPRLRLGIGPKPPGFDAASFVLSAFKEEEKKAVDQMVSLAKEAALCAAGDGGIAAAMSRYNVFPDEPKT